MKTSLSLRVSAGSLKNKRLIAPQVEGFRAVQEIAKQSVFSMLNDHIEGSSCLDLFSGSGNLGIEALSRGAATCTFVDDNYSSIGAITENVRKCALTEQATVVKSDAVKFAANTDQQFDLIFVDPFYDDTSHVFLLKNLATIVKQDGVIVFFHGENLDLTPLIRETNLVIADERKFGKSLFTLLKRGN